jgi:glycosyltransferase involved in cell wall biosynthesis
LAKLADLTFVICNYNYAEYLGECFTSIAPLVSAGAKVLVVDDGSSDQSVEEITKYREWFTQFTRLDRNVGLSQARNQALDAADTKFVCFFDTDDVCNPRDMMKLLAVATADQGPKRAVYYANVYRFEGLFSESRKRRVVTREMAGGVRSRWQLLLPGANPIIPSASLYRLDDIHRAGGFRPFLRQCGDLDLVTRLADGDNFRHVDAFPVFRRDHDQQLTKDRQRRRAYRDLIQCMHIAKRGINYFLPPDERLSEDLLLRLLPRDCPLWETFLLSYALLPKERRSQALELRHEAVASKVSQLPLSARPHIWTRFYEEARGR